MDSLMICVKPAGEEVELHGSRILYPFNETELDLSEMLDDIHECLGINGDEMEILNISISDCSNLKKVSYDGEDSFEGDHLLLFNCPNLREVAVKELNVMYRGSTPNLRNVVHIAT